MYICVCVYPISFAETEMARIVETSISIMNIIRANDLVMTGSRESAALVMTKYFCNVPALEWLIADS